MRGRKGERQAAGAGQVWNWLCVSARRSSSGGSSYSRESEAKEEEETAGVFESSPLCVRLVFLLLAGLTDLCLQFPLDTLQRAHRSQVNEPVGVVPVSVSRADTRV